MLLQAAVAQTQPLTPAVTIAAPASKWPAWDAQFTLRRFRSGETLPELRINYSTLGQPHRNAQGQIEKAVMVLHGTGGTGRQFLGPQFSDQLYGLGQPLDNSSSSCGDSMALRSLRPLPYSKRISIRLLSMSSALRCATSDTRSPAP